MCYISEPAIQWSLSWVYLLIRLYVHENFTRTCHSNQHTTPPDVDRERANSNYILYRKLELCKRRAVILTDDAAERGNSIFGFEGLNSPFLHLTPRISYQPSMLLGSWCNIARKQIWNAQKPSHHWCCGLNWFVIGSYLFGDIEAPNGTSNIDIERALSNMDSRAYSATCAVSKMISLIWVCRIDVLRSGQLVIKISFWWELVRLRM